MVRMLLLAATLLWSPPAAVESDPTPAKIVKYELEGTYLFLAVNWQHVADVGPECNTVTNCGAGLTCRFDYPQGSMRYRVRACGDDIVGDDGKPHKNCGAWTPEIEIIRCTHPTELSSNCQVIPTPVAIECPQPVAAPPQ